MLAGFRFFAALLFALLLTPLAASAHAVPVSYAPESSAVLDAAPSEVVIRFSEHIDLVASSLRVTDPAGALVSGKASLDPNDPQTLVAPVDGAGDGTYLVSWSVVSADDGHFTKGSYPFAVGKGAVIASGEASSEVVQITTLPEALAMTVELTGNGFLWAALVLFAFAIRPLLRSGTYGNDARIIEKGYSFVMLAAIALALAGAAFQIYTKSGDLASLQNAPFWDALMSYVQTAAGAATLWRMGAVAAVLAVFLSARKRIFAASRITAYEWGMAILMCVFAFFRAKISHATANPFFPDFSIAVNFVHLIEKDIWAGIIGILALIALSPRLRTFLNDLVPKAFALVAIDFAAVTVTACYIIWLHLKSFGNLFTTQWGGALLVLLLAAVLLVLARLYHVLARRFAPQRFARLLPATLAVELAFGLLVVYASSAIIITSPPLESPHARTFSATDRHVSITLERDPIEDGMALLTLSTPPGAPVPAVNVAGPSGTFSVELAKRFEGGYAFPLSFVTGGGPYQVSVTAPNLDGYDAHAEFAVGSDDFAIPSDAGAHRSFDVFTLSMIGIALLGLAFALLVWRFSLATSAPALPSPGKLPPYVLALPAFIVAIYLGGFLMDRLSASAFANPFKAQCVADGNMWHLMLPTRAGVALSGTSQEGCMWGMGNYPYLFADKREYDFQQSLGPAGVTLAHEPQALVAGASTTLTFALTNADGSPATLFVDMDKLIHVVIVSEDETVFAHIHPDDRAPLSQAAIDSSTFSVSYVFPKAGRYLVSADFAHGLSLESKQFILDVAGAPAQEKAPATYPLSGTFGGYDVSFDPGLVLSAGSVATVRYSITKDGQPVTNLEQYLSAAMHVSVVKDDFSAFVHVHGEVHPPGTPYPPIIVKDGKVVHSMAMMTLPDRFGPFVEAHLIFPSSGIYTIWGEFKVDGTVIPTAFTVNVQD